MDAVTLSSTDRARIRELELQIEKLTKKNNKLNKDMEESGKLKSNLGGLMDSFTAKRKSDCSVVSTAGLLSNRCVDSFLRELNSRLQSGTNASFSSGAASGTDSLIKKQRNMEREIDINTQEIRDCKRKIAQIKENAARLAAQAESGVGTE
jgi:predicted  nucleic acid-binding Zn-ribbon protein